MPDDAGWELNDNWPWSSIDNSHVGTNQKHHEQNTAQRQSFADDVRLVVAVMDELGSQFLDQTKELLTIDSQNVMPKNAVNSLEQIHTLGESNYRTVIEECILKNKTPISCNDSMEFTSAFPQTEESGSIQGQVTYR